MLPRAPRRCRLDLTHGVNVTRVGFGLDLKAKPAIKGDSGVHIPNDQVELIKC
jgi:hypothetical protein